MNEQLAAERIAAANHTGDKSDPAHLPLTGSSRRSISITRSLTRWATCSLCHGRPEGKRHKSDRIELIQLKNTATAREWNCCGAPRGQRGK